MKDRVNSSISIYRGMVAVVSDIPITPSSNRVFKLMSEDYITLVFSTNKSLNFMVGDYIDDELFGRFYLTTNQVGKYNQSTGGYDYELKFENQYMLWKNKIFCLCSLVGGIWKRSETQWSLTDNLNTHIQQVLYNLNSYGYGYYSSHDATPVSYTFEISPSVNSYMAQFIEYKGCDIIDAMKKMADAYECEWWVEQNVIHFGKCEQSIATIEEEELAIVADNTDEINVESIDVSRSSEEVATRIFGYGGTQNVPYSYGKKLEFEVTNLTQGRDLDGNLYYKFRDANRILTKKHLAHTDSITDRWKSGSMYPLLDMSYNDTLCTVANMSSFTKTFNYESAAAYMPSGTYIADGGKLIVEMRIDDGYAFRNYLYLVNHIGGNAGVSAGIVNLVINLCESDGTIHTTLFQGSRSISSHFDSVNDVMTLELELANEQAIEIATAGNYHIESSYTLVWDDGYRINGREIPAEIRSMAFWVKSSSVGIELYTEGTRYIFDAITYDGQDYVVYYNPTYASGEGDGYFAFSTNAQVSQKPQDFAVGDIFTIQASKLNGAYIPYSWYTDDLDSLPNFKGSVGERRLHLPEDTNGFLEIAGLSERQHIEQVVNFEQIFPRLDMIVGKVVRTKEAKQEELGDKSKKQGERYVYKIFPTFPTGEFFEFDRSYILDGLEVKFVVPEDNQAGSDTPYVLVSSSKVGEETTYIVNDGTNDHTVVVTGNVGSSQNEMEYSAEIDGASVPNANGEVTDEQYSMLKVCGGYNLAGMTFKAGFNPDAGNTKMTKQWYEVIFNEDFGIELPNGALCPKVGDPFILLGWNTKAFDIGDVNLVTIAQDKLKDKVQEYLDALQDGDFTLTVKLMSDFAKRRGTYRILAHEQNSITEFHVPGGAEVVLNANSYQKAMSMEVEGETLYRDEGTEYDTRILIYNHEERAVEHTWVLDWGEDSSQEQENILQEIASLVANKFLVILSYDMYITTTFAEAMYQYGLDLYDIDGNDVVVAIGRVGYYAGLEKLIPSSQGEDATLTCHVTSDTASGHIPFVVNEKGANNDEYELLKAGDKVCVEYAPLGRKLHSRVIGYEFKLDIPYDTPQYTIGETEAYSRLKKIEKELQKLN